jgi:hypothetical protein
VERRGGQLGDSVVGRSSGNGTCCDEAGCNLKVISAVTAKIQKSFYKTNFSEYSREILNRISQPIIASLSHNSEISYHGSVYPPLPPGDFLAKYYCA